MQGRRYKTRRDAIYAQIEARPQVSDEWFFTENNVPQQSISRVRAWLEQEDLIPHIKPDDRIPTPTQEAA